MGKDTKYRDGDPENITHNTSRHIKASKLAILNALVIFPNLTMGSPNLFMGTYSATIFTTIYEYVYIYILFIIGFI